MTAPLDLVNELISHLEGQLGLAPNEIPANSSEGTNGNKSNKNSSNNNNNNNKSNKDAKKNSKKQKKPTATQSSAAPNHDQPDICKLEFKVGIITKVWAHPDADRLYCEEIDVGEETGPRLIASGLRPFYTEEQMLGQRLLVVSNLKAKNLVGFKSHGMVLCASEAIDENDKRVEFIEPPSEAPLGEIVTFDGLPPPEPLSGSQVEKKKVFLKCVEGMKTSDDCEATWNGHVFKTSKGVCKSKTIRGGAMS
mmetsp:Transcript_52867/g.61749  ORF Transcript_52867/g.61749 Transcript_52867/m.61749 type:complete len:251 (-) Transcript_52867:147-899(-)